jgi:hypothetical protein
MSIASIILLIVKQQLQLEDRLLTALDAETAKFQSGCPPRDVLLRTIEIKNNINSGLNNIQNAIKNISLTGITNEASARAIEVLIELTTSLPVPNQTTTLGTTNTFAVKLIDLKEELKERKGFTVGLGQIITSLEGVVSSVQSKLAFLDEALLKCTQEQGIPFEVTNNIINDSTTVSTQELYTNTASYKGLTLEVVFDEEDFGTLKKRFGKATDRKGVIKAKTLPTFATDNNIILEELKFLIDNQA